MTPINNVFPASHFDAREAVKHVQAHLLINGADLNGQDYTLFPEPVEIDGTSNVIARIYFELDGNICHALITQEAN